MPAPVAAAPAPNAPTQAPATVASPANGAVKPAPVATKAPETGAEEPTFEVTVDGKPAKLTRKQIEKYAGKGAFADQIMRQAKEALKATAAEREERETLKRRIKEDKAARDKFLREHGIEPDDFARERLAERIAESEMTPEQKAAAAAAKENADLKAKLKAAEDEKAEARLNENAKRLQASIVNELDAAWTRAGFERGADAFYAVHEVMQEWNSLGLLDPSQPFTATTADRIIDAARENMEGTDKRREAAVLKGLKGKALVDRLGDNIVREVLRFKAEEFRNGGPKKTNGAQPAPKSEPQTFISPQEALKKMRGIG